MPSSIPAVPGAKVVKALQRSGFIVARINGSHHVMRHPDGRTVSVPVHGEDLKKAMRGILTAIGMTPDEFRSLL